MVSTATQTTITTKTQTSIKPSIRSEQILSPKQYANISTADAIEHFKSMATTASSPRHAIPYTSYDSPPQAWSPSSQRQYESARTPISLNFRRALHKLQPRNTYASAHFASSSHESLNTVSRARSTSIEQQIALTPKTHRIRSPILSNVSIRTRRKKPSNPPISNRHLRSTSPLQHQRNRRFSQPQEQGSERDKSKQVKS